MRSRRYLRHGVLVALVALRLSGFVTPAAHEQGPAPSAAPTVRLDVVVTNESGHAIRGLQRRDFEIVENGLSRPPVSVAFHRRGGGDTSPIVSEADARRAAGQPGTRVFAFFLDEFHVSAGHAELVRRTVADFIDEKVEPRDLVAVMKPFDPATSLRFTRDRALAHGVVASFEGRKEDHGPRTPAEEHAIGRDPATVGAARAGIVKAGLRDLALRMGALNAERPIIVVFSEGVPPDSQRPPGSLQELGGLLRAASRFHEVIFTFNPGPRKTGADRETMAWLAAQTGGRHVDGDRFIHGAARLFHDSEEYYAVTYQPSSLDGQFHALGVRTRRASHIVQSPRGHWAMGVTDWHEVVSLPPANVPASSRALRRSPVIDAWIGLEREPPGKARMIITWEPRRTAAGLATMVEVKARSVNGEPLFAGKIAAVGATSEHVADSARFDVPAGRVEVDLTILDGQGKMLDTDVRSFDVPDFRSSASGGPTPLPVWIVRARTPRGLQTASASPSATPAASRTFAPTDSLLVRVAALDDSAAAQVTATLLNRTGAPMRSLDRIGDPREGFTDFVLPAGLVMPGEYQIELRVSNRHGTIADRITFRVRK